MTITENSSADALGIAEHFDTGLAGLAECPETHDAPVQGRESAARVQAWSRRNDSRVVLQAIATAAPLVAADALAVVLAGSLASLFGGILGALLGAPLGGPFGGTPELLPLTLFLAVCFVLINGFVGLYPGAGLHPVVELRQSTMATVLLLVAPMAAAVMNPQGQPYRDFLLFTGMLTLILAPLVRTLTRQALGRTRWWGHPVLIFGGGAVGERTYQYLKSRRSLGFRPLGIVDEPHRYWSRESSAAVPYLGSLEEVPTLARRNRVYWGVIAMADRPAAEAHAMVQSHAWCIPHLLVIPDMAGFPSLLSRSCECAGAVGIEIRSSLLLPVPRLTKRLLDLLLVFLGGMLLLPLLTAIALLVKFTSTGPIFYCQQRIGRNGRRFAAWKFRTMVVDADATLERHLAENPAARAEWRKDHKLRNDPRITTIGTFLRKSSLDELPQIWNVLRGEMSLVGPRPIVDSEIAKYDETFRSYLRVRPGITGLWQVSGRNNTTYEERVELDSYYVTNWSPWLDVYILARTVRVVLRQEGAY